jgi:protein ImuA
MNDAAARIAGLRASLAQAGLETLPKHARVPLGHREADLCLHGGLERGTLHEIFAAGAHETAATGFAAALGFRVAGKKRLLWIRQDFSALEHGDLSATGFLEMGFDPSRILMLRVAHAADGLRAAADALCCAALGAVVLEIPGEPKILDLVASRRLTLACAQKNVSAFLLRFGAKPQASTAETRWLVRAAPSSKDDNWGNPVFETDLLRNRHGRTGHWVMQWSCEDGCFHAAHSGAVVPAPCDRPPATGLGAVA